LSLVLRGVVVVVVVLDMCLTKRHVSSWSDHELTWHLFQIG
jgi:hypothetical protein